MKIRVVVSGRSYHVAEGLPAEIELPESATTQDAISTILQQLPAGESLADSCLVAVGGQHLGTLSSHQVHSLQDGDELTLIAPVAGG